MNNKQCRITSKPLTEYELRKIFYADYIPMATSDSAALMREEFEWAKNHGQMFVDFAVVCGNKKSK